ncbi:MAG TPA: TetR/AcrR family transcriptional regulator [Acidimicrobiia bacterium]|nr:TetR/AcrR family transcriptional regulator [Acidimicrobiia bacterium]
MQNAVPASATTRADAPVAERVASRSAAGRTEAYADEVRRLVEAGYTVMRRTGTLDPRVTDIVREAGLSNQAFYRHFRGKDELLVAILDDGRRRLLTYLEHRMADVEPGEARVRAWVGGVMEQARNPAAADNTRPFAINNARLADRFPYEVARSQELLMAPLRDAVADAGGDPQRDADVIYHLAFGCMNEALVARRRPAKNEVAHLEEFVLGGLRGT